MKYSILIQGSPFSTKACHSAYTFSQTLLAATTHQLEGVFFYGDSVLIANKLMQPPRDEYNITSAWQQLAEQHNIPLYICIAAAVRRGIINETEMQRYELSGHTLAAPFQLEGLGSLVQLMTTTDRLITFR